MTSGKSSRGMELDFFTPCPACGEIGFTVQVWIEGIQMMECVDDECRVHEYEPREVHTDTDQ